VASVGSSPCAGCLYSADLGQTALDHLGANDRDPNSVFTRVLLPKLSKPDMDFTALAIDVREDVAKLAGSVGHEQRPAYYDETIGGRIYLAGLPRPDSGSGAMPTVPQQSREAMYVVANTRPPDAFLALRTHPSTHVGQRIAVMPNGTELRVLERRMDGWWRVRMTETGLEGWALSAQGDRSWIVAKQSVR
jgi:Bacterial SH3 domain